jgi:nucleotide-binding universal stress UspA family protein
MANFQHILFPIDFSPQSSAAIPYVAAFSRQFEAKVTLLTVVPPIWVGSGSKLEHGADLEDSTHLESSAIEDRTRERLDQTLTAEVHGLTMERAVRSGDPVEQIIRFARENAVDLIMMPTHGVGVFRSLLIGSVTAKILHDAECPVWTAAHAEEQHARHLPESILCVVDGTANSVEQMRWAVEFSGRFDATLQLLHVVPPILDWNAFADHSKLQEEEREKAHAQIEVLRSEAGVEAPLIIGVGPIAETVAECASDEKADLLIIGRGQIGEKLGRLRTHAYDIVQRSPCPVISV